MTATEDDVLYALLSLDAYNRGYAPGMDLPDNIAVDGAQRTFNSVTSLGKTTVNANFYAQAYSVGGKTVIASRANDEDALAGACWPYVGKSRRSYDVKCADV